VRERTPQAFRAHLASLGRKRDWNWKLGWCQENFQSHSGEHLSHFGRPPWAKEHSAGQWGVGEPIKVNVHGCRARNHITGARHWSAEARVGWVGWKIQVTWEQIPRHCLFKRRCSWPYGWHAPNAHQASGDQTARRVPVASVRPHQKRVRRLDALCHSRLRQLVWIYLSSQKSFDPLKLEESQKRSCTLVQSSMWANDALGAE